MQAHPIEMNITILGLWHLGSVTAACCAKYFRVNGLDFDVATIAKLNSGVAPLFEPGLDDLIGAGIASKNLFFTSDAASACDNADILWVCYDTPVNDYDESDVNFVLSNLGRALPHLPEGALVLISSQLPVGTCAKLEAGYPWLRFACSPENLRLGRAIDVFCGADRFIVGTRDDFKRPLLEKLFAPFTSQVIFMRTESAEMVKHALNSFLAVSVTFINEVARLCEQVGADAGEVSSGLKSDIRIGSKAYLGPGGAFAGGTLARDVVTLTNLAATKGEIVTLISAIKQSNEAHRRWGYNRLLARLGELRGSTIAVLGLTYKPGTDTLRRSSAVQLCEALLKAGCAVRAFDPMVKQLPSELSGITLTGSVTEALVGTDAAAVCTEWPDFRQINWPEVVAVMRSRVIVDANRFLENQFKNAEGVEYLSVGRR
jgi:UDPglucose 6-dehydrogenase